MATTCAGLSPPFVLGLFPFWRGERRKWEAFLFVSQCLHSYYYAFQTPKEKEGGKGALALIPETYRPAALRSSIERDKYAGFGWKERERERVQDRSNRCTGAEEEEEEEPMFVFGVSLSCGWGPSSEMQRREIE